MDKSQDRPSFYLYLQSDIVNAEKIRLNLDGLRSVITQSITGWLKTSNGNLTMLELTLEFANEEP